MSPDIGTGAGKRPGRRFRRRPGAATTVILAAILSLTFSAAATAQEPVVEQQVALDEAGRLLRVDAELARRLGVFGDLSDVREILLFRGPDGYVLEVTRRRGGLLVRERSRLTEAQVAALRAEVSVRMAERAPAALLDRSGRLLLLGTTTAAGLGFYGWAVPSVLDVEDTRGQVALYMLVASASFFGPWAWSAGETVTSGMANAAFWGASRGIVHGIALHRVITGAEPEFVQCLPDDLACFDRNNERREDWERGRTAVALAGSVAEAIGALAWARGARATAGDAHLLGTASDFGALGAVGLGVVAGLQEGDERALWGLSLAGAGLGLGGGAVMRARRDHSWGDVEVLRAAGLLGAYTGVAAAHGLDFEDRGTAAAALAGGTLGLVAGDRIVRTRDLTTVQGLVVDLGTVAGGLLGLGTAVLIADDASTDGTLHFALSAIGGWAGFGLTFRSLSREEQEVREGEDSSGGRGAGPLRLDLAPLPGMGKGGSGSLPPLGLRLRYSF